MIGQARKSAAWAWAVAIIGLHIPGAEVRAASEMPEPLEAIVLPEKPPGSHWVWIGDFAGGAYGRSVLYDADRGALLGMIDFGWEGIKLDFPKTGPEIYNLAMYMSRGYRGERTDTVTTYDKHTLRPLREVIVPPKGIHGWPDVNHTAISDDDRLLFMQFFTPASSIGVVDLKNNSYLGEIETSGCAHVMAAGAGRVLTLCGDGSALEISVADDGKERTRQRFPGLFNPDVDPIYGSGVRSGNLWYFVSYQGKVHAVDASTPQLKVQAAWSVAEVEGQRTWVPGPLMQPMAIHHASQRLYVSMHLSDLSLKGGGTDFHGDRATEVWVFDLATKRRLQRIALKRPTQTLSVSQDSAPLLYAGAHLEKSVTVYDAATGSVIREIEVRGGPTIIQPVP